MYLKLSVLFFVCISMSTCSKRLSLPSFINRCSISSPDFDDCCLKSAKEAINGLKNGLKKYNFPSLTPLLISYLTLEQGKELSLNLSDVRVYGLDKPNLKKLRFDVNEKKIIVELRPDRLELFAKYVVDGRILVVPLQGQGDLNMTAVSPVITYNVDYKLEELDGEDYLQIRQSTANLEVSRVYFHLTNLFNGNEELGASTNKFLNDEWEELYKSLKPTIIKVIISVADGAINAVASTVPYKDIFLK